METQQEEARAAASRSVLSGLAPALAQAYVLNYVPENVAQMLAECFPSVDSVRLARIQPSGMLTLYNLLQPGPCAPQQAASVLHSFAETCVLHQAVLAKSISTPTSLRDYHLCLPLYMDTNMHILQRTLSLEHIGPHQQQAVFEVLSLYDTHAKRNASAGALIFTTRDPTLLSGWPLTDLCVVASLLPFHLPPTSDQREMLLQARTSVTMASSSTLVAPEAPPLHAALPSKSTSKSNTAGIASTKSTTAGISPTKSLARAAPERPNTKMSRWLCFEDPTVEHHYDLWLGANNLRVQRMIHLAVGWPWSIFSGFTEPWHLVESFPALWVIMLFVLASLFYLFFVRPSLYHNFYGNVMLWGWFSTGWFFPLSGAHIPVQRLGVETLSKGPWFQSSIGCLTACTVPLIFMPKFVNFCPYQFLLLLAHTPATIVLAGKLGLARTIFKALAWQLCFSMGVVGAVVYIIDNKSRHSFIMSLEAAHARAAAAAAAAAVVGDGVDDVWDAGDGKAMASSPKKGGVYARKHA